MNGDVRTWKLCLYAKTMMIESTVLTSSSNVEKNIDHNRTNEKIGEKYTRMSVLNIPHYFLPAFFILLLKSVRDWWDE